MSQPVGPTMPTIGRIVHITDDRYGVVPAIVTSVLGDGSTVTATVFWPDGPPEPIRAPHFEPTPAVRPRPPAGTWHWPVIR